MNGNKQNLNEKLIGNLKPRAAGAYLIWDKRQRGFAVQVQPTGRAAYKCIYSFAGRVRWYHIAECGAIATAEARKLAGRVMYAVAEGQDPQAERKAARSLGTFEEIHERYVNEYASKKNKSWKHTATKLVQPHLLPRWGKLHIANIGRADVEAIATSLADRPVMANQVIAAASAIFNWAIKRDIVKTNPCALVDKNDTRERERVLSDSELPLFWQAFEDCGLAGQALKMLLLTGQRPGEVLAMRSEHIVDGWWEMPGAPVGDWPGTKNGASHRVWLPKPAQQLLKEMFPDGPVFPVTNIDATMRAVCKQLGVTDKVTPHDLRRTHGTTVARLGFGRAAMNRVQNHKEGGIGDTYDRYNYEKENQTVMEAVAAQILRTVAGEREDVVVAFRK